MSSFVYILKSPFYIQSIQYFGIFNKKKHLTELQIKFCTRLRLNGIAKCCVTAAKFLAYPNVAALGLDMRKREPQGMERHKYSLALTLLLTSI